MSIDVHLMIAFLADDYEKMATEMQSDAQRLAEQLPATTTEFDRGYFAGYTDGQIKELRETVDQLRQVLRDNPPSRFNWPRISLGFTRRF